MPKLFAKGYDERRNLKGAPKKLASEIVQQGYTLRQARTAILNILALTEAEVLQIVDDETASVLERTIAAAVVKDMKKGRLNNLEALLTRAIGKPAERINLQHTEITVTRK